MLRLSHAPIPQSAFRHVTIQALTFGLEGNLDANGQAFLASLGIS